MLVDIPIYFKFKFKFVGHILLGGALKKLTAHESKPIYFQHSANE